jgi:polar amino acid transport system substrate-binding protein
MNLPRRSLVVAGISAPWVACAQTPVVSPQGGRLRELIVAYNEDFPPYSFMEEGVVTGILPAVLGVLLSGIPDLNVKNVGLPWLRVQQEVQRGISDAFCTFASIERQQYAAFHVIPVVTLRPHLFFSANNPLRKKIEQVTSREELKALRLIDLRGNQWAEENLKDFPTVEFVPKHDNVFRMIMSGRGDVHVSLSPIVTQWRIKKLGLSNAQIVSIPAPYISAQVPFHLLIGKQYPRAAEVLKHVDEVLGRPATTRQIDAVSAHYS